MNQPVGADPGRIINLQWTMADMDVLANLARKRVSVVEIAKRFNTTPTDVIDTCRRNGLVVSIVARRA